MPIIIDNNNTQKKKDFSGIKQKDYHAIKNLNIDDHKIKYFNLPGKIFPNRLEILNISCRLLCKVNNLPKYLTEIHINKSNITELPELPEGLQILKCCNSKLKCLSGLPNTIHTVNCENNEIETIDKLPENLITLNCMHNKLKTLPYIPKYITKIECTWNELEILPDIVHCTKLKELYCGYNNHTEIPKLPKKLTILRCRNAKLTSLPNIPKYLTEIYCMHNNISVLNDNNFENVKILNISSNPLNSIPDSIMCSKLKFYLDNFDTQHRNIVMDYMGTLLLNDTPIYNIIENNYKKVFNDIIRDEIRDEISAMNVKPFENRYVRYYIPSKIYHKWNPICQYFEYLDKTHT